MAFTSKILLLGSGELGREFVISAKRLGAFVIAVDHYENAPAMQLSDAFEIANMLDGECLQTLVDKYKPNFIVPEIEAIKTEQLFEFEKQGITVIPTAEAAHVTMHRDAIRQIAAKELHIRTAHYAYASSFNELKAVVSEIGLPCVIKPVMSSSGKGQSIIHGHHEIQTAWESACSGMRGDIKKVIVEEFINFDFEITLLTLKQWNAPTLFLKPIAHRQENGDYRESWQPVKISNKHLKNAQAMALTITDRLGGAGIFGVEFFITKDEVIFSEVSPRPHDTGMVTLISQNLSEFDLHARAILNLPVPKIEYYGASASAVILSQNDSSSVSYAGIENALQEANTDIRIFSKPIAKKNRRMGITLARAKSIEESISKARRSAACVHIGS